MVDLEITAPVAGSDHNLLNFKIVWKRVEAINKNDTGGYNYQKGDYVEIRKLLSNICWDEKFTKKTVNEMWTIFWNDLVGVRVKVIPRRSSTRRLFPFWMKIQIKRSIKKGNKAWSNFNKCSSHQKKEKYRKM